nr:hypothetical protein [Brucella intermedia]
MASKRKAWATSILIIVGEACVPLLPIAKADTFPIDSKGPDHQVIRSSGIGTETASLEAQTTMDDINAWCENWRPGDDGCASDMSSELDTVYHASANCSSGEMITPLGVKLKWAGLNRGEDFNGFYQFTDVSTGKKVGFSNAAGGVGLMAQWMTLCPYGLPYSELPMDPVIDPNLEFPRLRDRGIVQVGELVGHNGSLMALDLDLGIIVYREPRYKSIEPNTVLFRGSISFEAGLPTRGMAYAFKKGCEPQAYWVEGYYGNDGEDKLVLRGEAPVWDGCSVKGYSSKSKNAELVFELLE